MNGTFRPNLLGGEKMMVNPLNNKVLNLKERQYAVVKTFIPRINVEDA